VPPRDTRPCSQKGSISAELVILTPVVVVFVMLVLGLGRYELARQQVIGAARAGADAAAVVSSANQAQRAATDAATQVVGSRHSCTRLEVVADTGQFVPGGVVRVTVYCRVEFSDLTVPGLPGATTVQAVQVAPIDPYRSVR